MKPQHFLWFLIMALLGGAVGGTGQGYLLTGYIIGVIVGGINVFMCQWIGRDG